MLRRLYQWLTGKPWITTRSCAREFGPPPGAIYAEALRRYSDAQLIAHGDQILAELREYEAAVNRLLALARELQGRPEEVPGRWTGK